MRNCLLDPEICVCICGNRFVGRLSLCAYVNSVECKNIDLLLLISMKL
jgi:hypothetical protein